MGNNWPFREGSENWPFSATENWPFSTVENFPFGDSDNFPFVAAAPAAPIDGITAWLKLDDVAVGEFSTLENPGSAGGTWTALGSEAKSVVADGPNSMKYLSNPSTTSANTVSGSVVLAGKVLSDLFAADAGMIGMIFNVDLGYSDTVNDSPHLWATRNSEAYAPTQTNAFVCGHHESLGWIRPTIDNSSVNLSGYTTETWRTLVFRWDGTGSAARLNGGSWVDGGDGTLADVSTYLHLLVNFGNSTATPQKIAEFIVSTESSQATAETLETYLIGRAGL